MPEGDTLARAARSLHRWLAGREITGARGRIPARELVGATVERVDARGKHLLIRLSTGRSVHSHLGMTGSWHVYRAGERWRKDPGAARLVIEAGERVAVCFSAPTVELLDPVGERDHPSLGRLGPDVLDAEVDLDEVVRRARRRDPATPVGDVLLDQGVVAGIGNIWRTEALFALGVRPDRALSEVDDRTLVALVREASRMMRASTSPTASRPRPAVYGRSGRGCPRCGARIASARQGEHARTAAWCPGCQR